MGEEKNLVLPIGPESADVMLILDSATDEEAKLGRAFSGTNEKQLRPLCKGAGIIYDTTYRTLYIKQNLSYNGPKKKLREAAIAEAKLEKDYDTILWEEILSAKPKVIVPLGELSLQFIAGEKSISKFRGSILPLREDHRRKLGVSKYNPKILPTLPPKYFFVDPKVKLYVSVDFSKVAHLLNNGNVPDVEDVVWVADTIDKLNNFAERHRNAEWGVFDIETKFNIPVCIGFCFSDHEAICVPLVDNEVDNTHEIMLWKTVDELLRSKKWVNQNIKFDIQKLMRFGFQIPNIIGDTAIRSNILYPEFPKNLAFLNSIYTNIPYYKDEGKDAKDRKQLYLYCAKDCLSTYRIYKEQEAELEEFNLKPFESKINTLFWPYVRMEERGIRVDESRLRKLTAKYDLEYDIHRSWLEKKTYKGFNPHSPDQVSKLLYGEFELKEQRNRKTDSLETGEETIEYLLTRYCQDDRHKQLVLQLIVGCRKLHKVIEYCETVIHPDFRLRGSWDIGGTNTGRTACRGTTDYKMYKSYKDKHWRFTDCGRSIQTIGKHGFKLLGEWYGKDLRSIFVPSPGFILVEGDLAAAEARVDAVLAEDYDILKTYDIPPGVHIKTGEWIFGRLIDKKKEPDLYHIAKTIRHAGERNMFPQRCMMILAPFGNFSLQFCEEALTKFHSNQPNIRKIFHEEVHSFVQRHHYLISPHGRRRSFYGELNNETYNEAISVLPQCTVSDHMKFSMPMIEERMPGIRILAESHDSLLAEIKKDELEKYANIFKEIVTRPINFNTCSLSRDFELSIPCEMSYSEDSWQEMIDFKI